MAFDKGTTVVGKRECFNILTVRLKYAQKGYQLLKRKTDALNMKLHSISREILLTKFAVEEIMKDAFLSLAEVKFATGNISDLVLQNVAHAHVKIRTKEENMASVKIITHETFQVGSDPYELAGLARGGQHLAKLKKVYQKAIEFLVRLASLQSCFIALHSAMKVNETKVNALEFVVIPNIKRGLRCIRHVLEEMEREEFYRMKMIKSKKKKLIERGEVDELEPEVITIFNDPYENNLLYF